MPTKLDGMSLGTVTHVVRQFHPAIGGFEDVVLNLARIQRSEWGIDARVVTLDRIFTNARHTLAHEVNVEGIPVTRVAWRGSSRYPLAPGVLGRLGRADIVHVHAIDFFFDYLAMTRPWHRKCLVASTHGGFFHTDHRARLKRLWFNTVTRASVKAYDAIIAASESDAIMFAPIAGSRLVHLAPGVNLAKFLPVPGVPRDPRRILSFGRITRHKQVDRMVALVAALLREEPGWTLVIAGPEGDHPMTEIAAAVAAAGVQHAVRIRVAPADAELASEVAQASWFGSASSYEGFGIAAVEAVAAGLLPVLSDIAPFRRLHTKLGVGFLFDPAKPEAIVPTMLRQAGCLATEQTALQRQLAAAVIDYGWGAAAKAHMQLYEAVLKRENIHASSAAVG